MGKEETTSYRYVLEVRHSDCYSFSLIHTLKKYNVALCFHDLGNASIEKLCKDEKFDNYITSDFIYIRFHGYKRIYGGSYPNEYLERWAKRLKKWNKKGIDVFVYFNNDVEGFAIQNAKSLKEFITG